MGISVLRYFFSQHPRRETVMFCCEIIKRLKKIKVKVKKIKWSLFFFRGIYEITMPQKIWFSFFLSKIRGRGTILIHQEHTHQRHLYSYLFPQIWVVSTVSQTSGLLGQFFSKNLQLKRIKTFKTYSPESSQNLTSFVSFSFYYFHFSHFWTFKGLIFKVNQESD